MVSGSFRMQRLAATGKAGKIEVDTREKKFPALTRVNITGALRYLIGKG